MQVFQVFWDYLLLNISNMKKLKFYVIITVLIMAAYACSTSKAVISHGVDLSKYSYVVFGNELTKDKELADIAIAVQNEIVDTNVTIPEDVDIFNTDIELNIDNDQISIAMRGSSYTENVLCPVESNPGYPIYLFGMNERNTACVDRSYVRFYELKVYNGDSLWRHYVPIVDDRAIPCIYEIITDTKLYNSGPGDFISGGVK